MYKNLISCKHLKNMGNFILWEKMEELHLTVISSIFEKANGLITISISHKNLIAHMQHLSNITNHSGIVHFSLSLSLSLSLSQPNTHIFSSKKLFLWNLFLTRTSISIKYVWESIILSFFFVFLYMQNHPIIQGR